MAGAMGTRMLGAVSATCMADSKPLPRLMSMMSPEKSQATNTVSRGMVPLLWERG